MTLPGLGALVSCGMAADLTVLQVGVAFRGQQWLSWVDEVSLVWMYQKGGRFLPG